MQVSSVQFVCCEQALSTSIKCVSVRSSRIRYGRSMESCIIKESMVDHHSTCGQNDSLQRRTVTRGRLISAAPVNRRGQLGRCVAFAHGCCLKLTGKLIDLLSCRYRFRRLHTPTHTHTRPFNGPFFRDYPGEPVPER